VEALSTLLCRMKACMIGLAEHHQVLWSVVMLDVVDMVESPYFTIYGLNGEM
jgi:hypothetical protein